MAGALPAAAARVAARCVVLLAPVLAAPWHELRCSRGVNLRNVDWKRCCRDLWREVNDDQISNGAAALAFYMVLSLFPCAMVGLSILPYLPIANLERAIMDLVHEALAGSAADLLTSTVRSVVSQRSSGVLSFGLLFALWSASSGLHGLMQQLNVVYEVEEERTFLRARGVALVLTAAFFALILGAFALILFGTAVQNHLAEQLGRSRGLLVVFAALRWVIIISALHLAFALIYHLGPNRKQPFVLVTPGSVAATLILLGASFAFKVYVNRFATYDAVYGGLSGVIVLLLWLFTLGWAILFGGELNDVLMRHPTPGKHDEERAGGMA